MKIALGSDHAGYKYKPMLAEWLRSKGHDIVDFGTDSEDSVDYPRFVRPAALAVARGECERGIVLGGSGNGEAMMANRVKGVRCALIWNEDTARLSRSHNDANMISIGERLLSEDLVRSMVTLWLETPFEGGRHQSRIEQLDE